MNHWRLAVVAIFIAGCGSTTPVSDVYELPPGAIQDLNEWIKDRGPSEEPLDIVDGDDTDLRNPVEIYDDLPVPNDGAIVSPDDQLTLDTPNAQDGQPLEDTDTGPTGPMAEAVVSPALIDFGFVQNGKYANSRFFIKNNALDVDLEVTRFTINGSLRLFLEIEDEGKTKDNSVDYTLTKPFVIPPGETMEFTLKFSPTAEASMDAEILIYTSDPRHPDGIKLFIIGNRTRSCIRVNPEQIDFKLVSKGAVVDMPIKIESCGGLSLEITDIYLVNEASDEGLSLVFQDFPNQTAPTKSQPAIIASGKREQLVLRYSPEKASEVGSDGRPIGLRSLLAISSSAFDGSVFLPISGAAIDRPCAVPIIDADHEGDLFVGDLVHLSGSNSMSPFSEINSWSWVVSGPGGGPAVVLPFPDAPEVQLPLGAPGEYEVLLTVDDQDGHGSCSSAIRKFRAIPANKGLIALSWRPVYGVASPGNGPDADLHLLHQRASSDGWFDDTWDCYWGNQWPSKGDWGVSDPNVDDVVEMLQFSEDGMASEIIKIGMYCKGSITYRIGVHLYTDNGFGQVDAVVRVWDGLGGGATISHRLSKDDLWELASFACPSGEVVETNPPIIIKDYTK